MNEAGYLLDTNVVCEFMKGKKANPATMEWLRKHRDCRLYVSVISFGQIRRGVEALRLKNETGAAKLEVWLERLLLKFGPRILDFTVQEADAWGRIAPTEKLPEADMMIAATALVHGLTMVTRNAVDFVRSGAVVINPWEHAV